jgi:hypothetical protein
MSQIAVVKEAVKETLVGTTDEATQLSAQTKARFLSKAVKDDSTGELYLGPSEFIDAVAPNSEDYVSVSCYSDAFLRSFLLLLCALAPPPAASGGAISLS